MNILAYTIFFLIMGFIIARVGWLFYSHGQVYVDRLFQEELAYGRWINKLLLKAYYLFNLGYVALSIQAWQNIENMVGLLEKVASEIGTIVLLLALLHYLNMVWLQLYSNWKLGQRNLINKSINSKISNHGSE